MHLFVVRHPIFNRWKRVIGYEVLFYAIEGRMSTDREQESRWVMDAHLHIFRPMRLTSGKTAFVPVPRSIMVQELVTVLPPSQTVL
ncbi:hypothetical protein, partial [Escherichia coli]|uniref:hypothetical protein n=1 Tax=Escherichia coli TaxID=562 RepID=UPI001961D096